MIRQLLKKLETPRVQDALRIFGKARANTLSGRRIEMSDGSPVTVEHIMNIYQLPRDQAEAFVRRHA